MIWLAQASEIAGKLSQAKDTSEVLAWVVGGVCLALLAVVGFHLRQRAAWDEKLDALHADRVKSERRVCRALEALAELEPEEDNGD